jgi:hypothetical protein
LSQLYAAIEAVEGVDSAVVTTFKRLREATVILAPGARDVASQRHLEQAHIAIGEFEIVRLDNDPNLPEEGILRFNMLGGK